ncbi:probable phosphatase SPAC5H10.03 [Aspergillus awamori]|uniref:Probable phosphatase SPAC5H10.03 n=1 Tax=Aspergillus awamori TaxID=105351 RepID=A0A401KVI7_ASPAW|nr:probable phosphatase SPAC5H10.03 [Aspergillus awamori]
MAIYLHLVRHAQGVHNTCPENLQIRDPGLTLTGEAQCHRLCQEFPHHAAITHLVASPMRRTLQTCLLSFAPAVACGTLVTALPEIQEVSTLPCDTGSSPATLSSEPLFQGKVDFSKVGDQWNDKSPGAPWEPRVDRIEARAARARRWLRHIARESAMTTYNDVHIVVVSHGAMLHYISQDWSGLEGAWTNWENAEWRTYEFSDVFGDDERADLREKETSWNSRNHGTTRLTAAEQLLLKVEIQKRLQPQYDAIAAKQRSTVVSDVN